jgi:hypothetical protein
VDASLTEPFVRLKQETEAGWAKARLDRGIYGYQFQAGTRWNPGLSAEDIHAYERALDVRFPESLRRMLSVMNGTDKPTINLYGSSMPPREGPGVYAYPRDLELVREYVEVVRPDRAEVAEVLEEEGFVLPPDAGLVPLYGHRYLVCGADAADGPVLSIYGTDAIVYGADLLTYLRMELLPPGEDITRMAHIE